jgi:hypothetical protein
MRGCIALVLVLAACGRSGFGPSIDAAGDVDAEADAELDGAMPKPDAAPMADAAPTPDSPPGMGTYSVASTTTPYTLLAGGTVVPGFVGAADDESYALALPFMFKFYGVAFTSVNISMNGYVTFEAPVTGADTTQNDCPLDGTAPGATIAVFWDDLYADTVAPAGTMTYAITGATPNRRVTIEWRDMDAYYVAGAGNNSFTQGVRVTHSLTLREDHVFEMHYGPRRPPTAVTKDCGADRHRGCSATVGLEAPGGALFTPVQCGTAAGPGLGYAPIDEGKKLVFTRM